MSNSILGFWAPGPFEMLVVVIIFIIKFVIPVVLIVLFALYLVRSNKERRRLRLEVGKLADELEQMRKQKDVEKGDSSTGSG